MSILVEHEIAGGAAWSLLLRRGRELRLTARQAGANCSVLLFAAGDPVDRLNIPDTLKAQRSARVRAPMVLMSDRGNALASVTGSSLDWHDVLCGHSLDGHLAAHGASSYAADRNAWRRSGRAGLLSELRKHGRDVADLHGCVNFFAKVAIDDDERGTIRFVRDHGAAGDWVSLRAELDLLVIASTAPHPMDPAFSPSPVLAQVTAADPYGPDDPSETFTPESARALANSAGVFA